MTTRVQRAGMYGLVRGLGFPADSDTKSRLIKSAQRAANRGDWDALIQMGLAYLAGSVVGGSVRRSYQTRGRSQDW